MTVRIYWNRTRRIWSVIDRATRRVTFHAHRLKLKGVTFVVSQAGRERTLRTNRRSVHAYAEGELAGRDDDVPVSHGRTSRVTYSPFRHRSFVEADTGREVAEADAAWFIDGVVLIPSRRARVPVAA